MINCDSRQVPYRVRSRQAVKYSSCCLQWHFKTSTRGSSVRGKEGRKSGKQREGRERGGGNGRKARGGNVYHLTSCEGRRGELFLMQEMLAWESQGAPGTRNAGITANARPHYQRHTRRRQKRTSNNGTVIVLWTAWQHYF